MLREYFGAFLEDCDYLFFVFLPVADISCLLFLDVTQTSLPLGIVTTSLPLAFWTLITLMFQQNKTLAIKKLKARLDIKFLATLVTRLFIISSPFLSNSSKNTSSVCPVIYPKLSPMNTFGSPSKTLV